MSAVPIAVTTTIVNDVVDQTPAAPLALHEKTASSDKEPVAQQKHKSKGITQASKTIPSGRLRRIVKEIETVLLEITVDETVTSNPLELRPAIPTLNAWADHLRSALKELTK
jgi:hypothetical protein